MFVGGCLWTAWHLRTVFATTDFMMSGRWVHIRNAREGKLARGCVDENVKKSFCIGRDGKYGGPFRAILESRAGELFGSTFR